MLGAVEHYLSGDFQSMLKCMLEYLRVWKKKKSCMKNKLLVEIFFVHWFNLYLGQNVGECPQSQNDSDSRLHHLSLCAQGF